MITSCTRILKSTDPDPDPDPEKKKKKFVLVFSPVKRLEPVQSCPVMSCHPLASQGRAGQDRSYFLCYQPSTLYSYGFHFNTIQYISTVFHRVIFVVIFLLYAAYHDPIPMDESNHRLSFPSYPIH